MKNCPKCNTEIDDVFDMCWNCNFSFITNEPVAVVIDTTREKSVIDVPEAVRPEKLKNCPNCFAEVEANFDMCWNCCFSFAENKIIEIKEAPVQGSRELDCLRCNISLQFAGNYKFPEGERIAPTGELINEFVDLEPFDLYVCKQCGKVEFYSPLLKSE